MFKGRALEIGFVSNRRVSDLVRYAELAESHGFDAVWLGEHYYARGLFTIAAAIAAATTRIQIGLGIVSPFSRHPGLIAMEAAALDEFSAGRLILALGDGQMACDRQGLTDIKPAVSLREAVDIVRGLLSGQTVTYGGRFFRMTSPGSRLDMKPYRSSMPIHLGVMGPKSLQLAGKIADGVVFAVFSTPGFLRWAIAEIEKGLTASGRLRRDFELRCYIPVSIDKDSARAKDAARPFLANYLSEALPSSATAPGANRWKYSTVSDDELLAVKAEITKYIIQGDLKKAEQSIPVSFINKVVVAGTPDECRELVVPFLEIGLDYPVFFQVSDTSAAEAIPLIKAILMDLPSPVETRPKQ